jgi:ribosomal protein L37AE/L43A
MKIFTCPRCQRQSLIPTGAYWGCGCCSYAITQAALIIDQRDARARIGRGRADGQARDNTTL